jgi:acyl-CoA thioester hydrolase
MSSPPDLPIPEFVVRRRVEFAATDAAGIMHFSAFFLLMEQAEHEFLRARGLSVLMQDSAGKISWPRVSAKCEYTQPARFEDLLEIGVSLVRLGEKSATYVFTFRRDGAVLAQGEMTSVCCRITAGVPPRAMSIPEFIRSSLRGELGRHSSG